MRSVRIGAGAGFAGDRIDPAVDLAEAGQLDFLVFECLAERTTALSHLRKRDDPNAGYDPLLAERMIAVLPACRRGGVRVIGNMGAANPKAAAKKTIEIARALGLKGLRVAFIEGDDVLDLGDRLTSFDGQSLPPPDSFASANAYLGAEWVAEAFNQRADVVITGRVADPSLFLGAFLHAFCWAEDAWDLLGQGIVIGHMLECAAQLTGGYFADPGYKDVEDLDRIGFPLAEVDMTGAAVLTKLPQSGGVLNLQTCREQLLYEVQDPARYITPDVIANFSTVRLEQEGKDRVKVTGGSGAMRPPDYKVSVGMLEGFVAEAQISYAGAGALERTELARSILQKRMARYGEHELRFDIIGLSSIDSRTRNAARPHELRLRAAGRFKDEAAGHRLMREVESLYLNGPAGGAGVTSSIRESIAIVPALIARELVCPTITIEEA